MSAAATVVGGGSTAAPPVERLQRAARRNAWTVGLVGVLAAMLAFTKIIQPNYGPAQIQGLAIGVLPVALAAIAQAIIVISGGIDLSVASIMSLTGVTAAVLLDGQGEGVAILLVLGVLALGIVVGAINGSLIVVTRVPDIVVTLAMSFVWAGTTLLVLDSPGGGSVPWLQELVNGSFLSAWVPRAFLLLAVIVLVVWMPLRRSMLGLSMYALGSSRLAAFRSGVPVGRTKVAAYAIGGLFCAFGGLAINAATGSGSPVPGPYTLQSVAAVVLGGVSLAGGRGGIVGPIVACVILQLVRTDLTLLGVSPSLSTAIQGLILISVVLVGSVISMRRVRR
jgi:ribose transport system permease protein